jgi:hypothetical protein
MGEEVKVQGEYSTLEESTLAFEPHNTNKTNCPFFLNVFADCADYMGKGGCKY